MSINDFIGNRNEVQCLYDWLKDFYKGFKQTNYAVIIASSGNGKSFLLKLLANEFDADLLRIQPFSIETKTDLNNYIKSINIDAIDYKRKLIAIDDFDDFHFRYKSGLLSIPEISRFPVIFTSRNDVFPKEMKSNALKSYKKKWCIKLYKPVTSQLLRYLISEGTDIPEKELEVIAKESKSVRSAILTLRNRTVNKLVSQEQSNYAIIDDIRNRKLKVPLTRKNINWIIHSIRGCGFSGSMEDLDTVLQKFSEFHYRIFSKHETYDDKMLKEGIDPFFVNNMKEPVEKVYWKYTFKNKKIERNEKIKHKEIKQEKPKAHLVSPIEKWGI